LMRVYLGNEALVMVGFKVCAARVVHWSETACPALHVCVQRACV